MIGRGSGSGRGVSAFVCQHNQLDRRRPLPLCRPPYPWTLWKDRKTKTDCAIQNAPGNLTARTKRT